MRHHELFVLVGRRDLLAEFAGAQGAIHQRHRHGLAFALSEGEAIAAGEARRFRRRALELVDHLAFGQGDGAERHRETRILGNELHLDLAEADLAGERVVSAVAALRGIAQRQQKSLVAAGQILQPQIALGGKIQRLAGEIAHRGVGIRLRRGFDQAVVTENVGDPRHGSRRRFGGGRRFRIQPPFSQLRIQQAMGVVEGRAEHLTAGNILESRRNPPPHLHRAGVHRLGGTEARQGGAKRAQQEDRLDHVAARLLDGQCGEFTVV
jgi:hypothetical protein